MTSGLETDDGGKSSLREYLDRKKSVVAALFNSGSSQKRGNKPSHLSDHNGISVVLTPQHH